MEGNRRGLKAAIEALLPRLVALSPSWPFKRLHAVLTTEMKTKLMTEAMLPWLVALSPSPLR